MSSWTRRHITVDGPWPLGHQAMKLNKVLVRKSSTAHVISTSTNYLGALAKKTQPADDDANVEGGRGYLKHHQTATSATRPTMHHRTSEGQEEEKKETTACRLPNGANQARTNMPNVHPKHSSPKHHVSHSSERSSRRHRKVGDMETLVSQRHGDAGELLLRNLVEHDKDGALQCLLVHLGAIMRRSDLELEAHDFRHALAHVVENLGVSTIVRCRQSIGRETCPLSRPLGDPASRAPFLGVGRAPALPLRERLAFSLGTRQGTRCACAPRSCRARCDAPAAETRGLDRNRRARARRPGAWHTPAILLCDPA